MQLTFILKFAAIYSSQQNGKGGKTMNLNDIIHNEMRHKHIPMDISLLSMTRNVCQNFLVQLSLSFLASLR